MAKRYRGEKVVEDQSETPRPTDFTLPKPKEKEKPKLAGPERSRGAIDLKEARRTLKRLQKPFR